MSTRYVWEKFETDSLPSSAYEVSDPTEVFEAGNNYVVSGGKISLTGATSTLSRGNSVSIKQYKFLLYSNLHLLWQEETDDGDVWDFTIGGTLSIKKADGTRGDIIDLSTIKYGNIKGPLIGNVSSSKRSSYPDDWVATIKGGSYAAYWYTYKGSDNIGPLSIWLSKTSELEVGEAITISVTPSPSPVYGGTVYYLYQYSANGGRTWNSIGSRTTETSVTVTIPEGAEQFRARAYAVDNWGFISDSVTTENVPVSQIKAYATVSEKLRAGAKIHATVGGKIRQVQKGYATVGGKIRKMF